MSAPLSVKALARAAVEETFSTPEPQPLFRLPRTPTPYPIQALISELSTVIRAVQQVTQAPMALCAQTVLAAVALAAQGHADVQLPTGEITPLSLYLMTIADSGERKSACDNLAQRGVVARERVLSESYEQEIEEWRIRKEAWDKASAEATGPKIKGVEAKRNALAALGPEPRRPRLPMLTVDEPTLEGLVRLFQHGFPSLGLFAGEAATFLGGHGMTSETKTRMAGGLTHLYDGKPLSRIRAGEQGVLAGCRLSVNLMAQPAVAEVLLGDTLIAGPNGQGLLNRFLIAAPDSTAGTRFFDEPPPEARAMIERFAQKIQSLLSSPLPLAEGRPNQLQPRIVTLSTGARLKWVDYQHDTERRLAPGGELHPVRGLANRLPAHAARLAAVQIVFADLEASEVTEQAMVSGIALADYYAAEALRLADTVRIDPDLAHAARVLAWLRETWGEPLVSLPDLYQLGPHCIRTQSAAHKVVGILLKHGHLVQEPGPAVVGGKRRREVWRIVGE